MAFPTTLPWHCLVLSYCCTLLLAASACGRGEDPAYSRGSTVVISFPARPDDPLGGTSAWQLAFLPLTTWDENWELVGRLARRWEHSPDYREWTYHLRTDVRWHDGVAVTAHDVKFTLDVSTHPDVLRIPPSLLESVTLQDDSTVTIRFSADRGFFDVEVIFFPKHLLEHLDPKRFYSWEFWTRPVGNGPYRFVRHVAQTMMEFEANPDYYRGKPRIERVVLKFVGEEAGVAELLSGNADVFAYTNPSQVPKLAGDPRFHAYHWLYIGVTRAIYWRSDHPIFSDPSVRRALTLAIDRRELMETVNLPPDLPVFDVVYTPRQFRRGELPPPLPYDPEAARELLDAAGWIDRNGDGIRERDGREFRFAAIVPTFPGFEEMAIYVQSQLHRLGIRMDVEVLESGMLGPRVRAGEFEAAVAPFRHEPLWLRNRFTREFPLGYRNPEVVALIEKALGTLDPNAVDSIYVELMEIFRLDLPVTFLHPVVRTFFVHRRLHGLSSPYRVDPLRFMEDLWLEGD